MLVLLTPWKALARMRALCNRRAQSILLLSLFLVSCTSSGDPERVEVQAQACKATAADEVNVLLYMAKGMELQTSEVRILNISVTAMENRPKAQDLQDFMSLAPTLVGLSESLRLTRPARAALQDVVTKSRARIDELKGDASRLQAAISQDGPRLGSSLTKFEQTHTQLSQTIVTLETFVSSMTSYVNAANDTETSATAMLREIDAISQSQTLQGQMAAIARLNAFGDRIVQDGTQMSDALTTEKSAQNTGLASLLGCFKTLDSLPGISPQLSQELKDAIKLVEDVQNGASFSTKEK